MGIGVVMDRANDDEQCKVFFKMDRFVSQNGEWFYTTREGEERGPFSSRDEAQGDLIIYLRHLHNLAGFGQ
jgi:hypothetical protein